MNPISTQDSVNLHGSAIGARALPVVQGEIAGAFGSRQVLVSVWGLSWAERLRVLFGGRVYLQVEAGQKWHPPVLLSADSPFLDAR